ncbi:MAG: hypothetical protein JW894_02900 [Bacteroidales bacterium]|nr:hypothetical protein [Bacteroidales bacterium]
MAFTRIKIFVSVFLIIIINTGVISAQGKNKIQYSLTETDTSYTFKGTFKINADPGCLINIFFSYEHLCALAPDAVVTLTEKGDVWNQVGYLYKKYGYFENRSEWFRELDKQHYKVKFTLISSENNKSIMPVMKSSSGYYQVKKKDNFYIVIYYQECTLSESALTNIYLNKAEKEAIIFLERLAEYSCTHCGVSSPIND